jgi:hypothetical protein
MSSSSDSNARQDPWAQHYRAASERRRARGWHRRDDARPRSRRGRLSRRARLYAAGAVIFVALTAVALLLPR